jgi:Xaa-Pro aminopeptidase
MADSNASSLGSSSREPAAAAAPRPSLDPLACRQRQARLCRELAVLGVGRALLTSPENIQYLTGFRPHPLLHAALCLETDGKCTLAAPNEQPEGAAFDRCAVYPAQHRATLRQDQRTEAVRALRGAVENLSGKVAVEWQAAGLEAAVWVDGQTSRWVAVDETLWRLRRKKDPDELAMIRTAIGCTDAMYARARDIIAPGVTELHVFEQLHAAAVEFAGEPLTALGNDFQCGTPGGPPRRRAAAAGELFILDLGPAYRGYYADNCRTFAVDRRPTDEQLRAWESVVAVLAHVERRVRPGASCRALFDEAQAALDASGSGSFFHHLGHGFGLYPHEAPRLNPQWDDVFAEGDCFTAEPGLYAPGLRGGIRLEQDYVVTADGVERLTHYPLEL